MQKAIILDRDGTIIYDKVYLNDPKLIEYIPGSFEALRMLRDLGYIFVIATNQSGVARGIVDIKNLYKIHDIIRDDFAREGVDFAGFYYAPFSVESNDFSRKPNPGMLLQAAKDHNIDLKQSWMIGDRMTDVEAGHNAGTKSILLTEVKPEGLKPQPEAVVPDLMAAAKFITLNRHPDKSLAR